MKIWILTSRIVSNPVISFKLIVILVILSLALSYLAWSPYYQHLNSLQSSVDHHLGSMFNGDYDPDGLYHPSCSQAFVARKDVWSLATNTRISLIKTRYTYQWYNPYFFELCTNPEYYGKFGRLGLVKNETLTSALAALASISTRSDKGNQSDSEANAILQVPFEIGSNLLNKLWIPIDNITRTVEKYVNEIFKGHFVIGIQLRYEYLSDDLYEDTAKFLACALEIESGMLASNPNLKFKWFVTTDRTEVATKLSQLYSGKVITGVGEIGHVDYTPSSYFRTILDVELLANCDELVVTGGSTYGFVGAMKKMKMPYHVNGGNGTKCRRMTLAKSSLTNLGYGVFK